MNIEIGTMTGSGGTATAERIPASRERVRLRLQALLMAGDLLAIGVAMLGVAALRFHEVWSSHGTTLFTALAPIYLAIAINGEAFGSDVLRHPNRGIVRALIALTMALGAVLFVAFYLKASADVSRIVIAGGGASAAGLIVAYRRLLHSWCTRSIGKSLWREVILTEDVACGPIDGFEIHDARRRGLIPNISDPMMFDRLGRFLQGVDRVIVACTPDRRELWASALKGANIKGEVLAPELPQLGVLGIGRFGDCSTVVVSTGPLGLRNRVLKRLMDVSLAVVALIGLAPLLVLVALAIKLDSPGPVLFVQQRLGRGNRLFGVYKFRSMRTELCDAEGKVSTARDDNRITRVGRFIRATSIDELPQLFNILFGDMSFVGPRPHALGSTAGDRLFWEVDSRYWHRHATKPGLTGLAQVRGYRGATLATVDLTNRLQADLEYLSGWTIWRDLSILVGTFRVLVHRNAF